MIIQLPNGKTMEMSVEQYLRMSDDEYNSLVGSGLGDEISDPFHGSVLRNGEWVEPKEIEELAEEVQLDADELTELMDVDMNEKLFDADFIDDNLET